MSVEGDVVVVDQMLISNTTVTFDENITIARGGALHIINSTILFNCSEPMQYGITVGSGGALFVSDLDGNTSSTHDMTILTGKQPFFLVAVPGSSLHLSNSIIRNCGEVSTLPYPFRISGGVVIRTNSFSIQGVTFEDSYYGMFLFSIKDGIVRNCTFRNLVYGIVGDMAQDISIEDCVFNGVPYCIYLRTAGIPPIPITGSVTIRGCRFSGFAQEAVHVDFPKNIMLLANSFEASGRNGVTFVGINPMVTTPFDANSTISNNVFDAVKFPITFDNIRDVSIEGSIFTNFTIAVSLNYLTSENVRFTDCTFFRGTYGIQFNVRVVSDITVVGNTFEKVSTGIVPKGDRFQIMDNTFEGLRVAGILHESDGVLKVVNNRFLNSSFGIKVQHELIPRPGLVLNGNEFVNNSVGLMAREVEPFSMGSNTWLGNSIAVLVLGMEVSINPQDAVADCQVAFRFLSSHGTLTNITVTDCDMAIEADLGSFVTVRDSGFSACSVDCVAGNGSTIRVIDTEHGDGFRVLDDRSSIQVLWTVVVHVSYISDGSAASDIMVIFTPASGTVVDTFTTDGSGDIGPILVLQSSWRSTGELHMLPYNVTVFYRERGHPFLIRFEEVHRFYLEIDDVPPTIILHDAADLTRVNVTEVDLTVSILDNESLVEAFRVELDGDVRHRADHPPEEIHLTVTTSDGEHLLLLNATDAWSNSVELIVRIYVDSVPPQLLLTSPLNGTLTNLSSILVKGTTVDVHHGRVGDMDLDIGDDGSFSIDVPLEEEGLNLVSVQVWDGFNNTATGTLHISRDTTPPWVEMDDIPALTNATSLRISGSTDGVRLRLLPDEGWLPVETDFDMVVDLFEGSNGFVIEVQDAAGNLARAEVTAYSDRSIEFGIDSPLNGATVEGNTIDVQGWGETGLRFRPSGTGSDGWRTVDEEGNFSITLTMATFGQNNFVFEVEDPAGNEASYPYNLNRVGMTTEPETDDPTLLIAVILMILAVIIALLFLNARKGGVEG